MSLARLVVDKHHGNRVHKNSEGHERNSDVAVGVDEDFSTRATDRCTTADGCEQTPLNERLVERDETTDNRHRKEIIHDSLIFFNHCYEGDDDLRVDKNTLNPAQIARWETDKLRVRKRADKRKKCLDKKQIENVGVHETIETSANFCMRCNDNHTNNEYNMGDECGNADERIYCIL